MTVRKHIEVKSKCNDSPRNVKKCRICGYEYPPDSIYCARCGNRIQPISDSQYLEMDYDDITNYFHGGIAIFPQLGCCRIDTLCASNEFHRLSIILRSILQIVVDTINSDKEGIAVQISATINLEGINVFQEEYVIENGVIRKETQEDRDRIYRKYHHITADNDANCENTDGNSDQDDLDGFIDGTGFTPSIYITVSEDTVSIHEQIGELFGRGATCDICDNAGITVFRKPRETSWS